MDVGKPGDSLDWRYTFRTPRDMIKEEILRLFSGGYSWLFKNQLLLNAMEYLMIVSEDKVQNCFCSILQFIIAIIYSLYQKVFP